jgi:glyoxylase-like metal-dependent hydrolase (beta-lactamase superfamily II)
MNLTRRTLLKSASATAALAATGIGPAWASTALAFGDMQVETFSDGFMTLPADFIFATMPQDELAAILERHGIAPGPYHSVLNVTLLRHGDDLVLFDAGSGFEFAQTAGELGAALEAAGVAPDDITHVVFTHGHPDHLWGILDDFDDPYFPNALHMIGRAEWDYWLNPNTVDTIGDTRITMAVGAKRRLEALANAFTVFDDGQEILPGIAARATYGHTPGHMSFELRSGNQSAMVLGDAAITSHVSFERPGWHSGSDQDVETAAASRVDLLDQLAHEQMPLIGYHLPNGGIGRAERYGDAYRFVPQGA